MEERSYLTAMTAPNLRRLLDKANKEGIQKESIVSILLQDEQYVLLYYRES